MRLRSPFEPKRQDIKAATLGELAWTRERTDEALSKLFAGLTAKAQEAITWYQQSRRPKKRGAISLRVTAILLGAAAGLLPLFSQIFAREGEATFSPIWTSIAVGLAATLLVLDRFFGCTSAWIRYIKAELEIQHLLEQFQLDWQAELATGSDELDSRKVRKLLEGAKTFLGRLNQIVQDETNTWIEEFKSTLKQIDELVKAQEAATAPAGLNVDVTNGDECEDGWTLTIDEGAERACRSRTAGLRGLAPGIHVVRVAGKIDGVDRQAEVTAAVPAGAVASVQLTLC